MDKMQKAENAGEVNWDDEGIVQFFTDDGQLKVRRAKAKKERKDADDISPASLDAYRRVQKDVGVLWYPPMKGIATIKKSVMKELSTTVHPRYLRNYLNYRVYYYYDIFSHILFSFRCFRILQSVR